MTTLVIFAGTFAVLSIFGFVPKQLQFVDISDKQQPERNINNDGEQVLLPDQISIPKIGVQSAIQRPQSQEVQILDQALEKGAVYYPGSGTINAGNMFIFGHSADFFNSVSNPAYRVFDGLSNLEQGDEIIVNSDGETFVYRVSSVTLVDENQALVEFRKTNRMLTLSTCNTFGQRQERWVVEAVFDREI